METQGQIILVKFKSKPSGTDKLLRKGEGRREGKKTSMEVTHMADKQTHSREGSSTETVRKSKVSGLA